MIRLLGDTRGGEGSLSRGIGIDREMALAIYRVGSDNEFAEVISISSFPWSIRWQTVANAN